MWRKNTMDDRIKQLIEYEIAQDEDMNYFEKGIALNLLELAIAKGDDYCIGLDNYKDVGCKSIYQSSNGSFGSSPK